MRTRTYSTRGRCFVVLLVTVLLAPTGLTPAAARVLAFGGGNLVAPRLSTGDSDGDAVIDAAVAGATGGRVDEAASLRSARVDWYASPGLAAVSSGELHVADDLTHADLDGDGRDEIVVVGAHSWRILQLDKGVLQERALETTTGPLWRVAAADVDGDGRDELALVTVQRGLVDEIPRATIDLVAVDLMPGGATLRRLDSWDVAAHIGDLCFADSRDGPMLIVETGAEEVGGRLHRLSTAGGLLREQASILTGVGRLRILSLSAVSVGTEMLLSLGDVSGRIRVVEWRNSTLRRHAVAPLPGAGATLARPAGGAVQMWIAPLRPGDRLGWWSPVDF